MDKVVELPKVDLIIGNPTSGECKKIKEVPVQTKEETDQSVPESNGAIYVTTLSSMIIASLAFY